MDALAGILANEHLEPDDIESIVCRVPAIAVPMVLEPGERKRAPSTPYEAKFSLPFCLATLLVHGDAGIERFTRDAIRHPGILALASRVGYVVEEFPGGNQLSGGVEVTTRDGRRLTAEVLHPRGGQANPVSAEDVERKFVSNAGLALGPDNAAALLDGLLRLGERPAAETGALLGRATGLVPA